MRVDSQSPPNREGTWVSARATIEKLLNEGKLSEAQQFWTFLEQTHGRATVQSKLASQHSRLNMQTLQEKSRVAQFENHLDVARRLAGTPGGDTWLQLAEQFAKTAAELEAIDRLKQQIAAKERLETASTKPAGLSPPPGSTAAMNALPGARTNPDQQPRSPTGSDTPRASIALVEESPEPPGSELFRNARTWTTQQGSKFEAFVTNIHKDDVEFERPQDGRKAAMAIKDLSADDARRVRLAHFDQQDHAQLNETRQLALEIGNNPSGPLEVLKSSHLKVGVSPYAGLWAAVCSSSGANNFEVADSMLQNVVSRIEDQREHDPTRHAMTLASAFNNRGVCKVKSHNFDSAASMFAQGLEALPTSSHVLIHNARQLRTMTADSSIKLNATSRRRLDAALGKYAGESSTLRQGWYYSLDCNLASTASSAARFLSQQTGSSSSSPVSIRDTWCVTCQGHGFHKCPRCNGLGSITTRQRTALGINPITGKQRYGDVPTKSTCPNCRGRRRFDCKHCTDGKVR